MALGSPEILTVGYGKRSRAELLDLLRTGEVEFLVDVRSSPYSRFNPDFDRRSIEGWLAGTGIRYVFRGDTLGGRPADRSCYDPDGHVDYARCRENERFVAAIERILAASRRGHRICLLCSELRPENCHRVRLLGEMIVDRGGVVRHFDASGVLRDQVELRAGTDDGQLALPTGSLGRSRKPYGDASDPSR